MAVTNEQKIDFLLKKIGYTKTKTGSVVGTGAISGTPKQPFAEAIPSPLIIANGALWNEADSIPATPPGADTTQVKVYLAATSGLRMTADATSSGQRAYIAYSTYGDTSSTRLTNWIDTQFGASYIIKVYKGDPNSGGVALSAAGSGANDGWFFDYSAGVLNFNDTSVPSGVTDTNIYIVGYRYIGQTGAPTSGISTFSYLDLTVERNLDVGVQGGISTFRNNIDLNADLDVDGHTNLDNVSIAGVSTFAGAIDLNADLDVDGHTDLDNVSVAGVSTFSDTVKVGTGVTALTNGNVSIGGTLELFNTTGNASNNPSEIKLSNFSIGQHQNTGTYKLQNSGFGGEILLSAGGGGYGGLSFWNSNFGRLYFQARDQGSIKLFHNNTVRFETSGIGATVYGQLDTTDLDVDGHTNLDNISVAGVSTFTGDATFSGNVSIGGTLTYEDVTNVDSVGLLTARSGIRVTGGVIEAQAGENKIPSLYAAMTNLPSAGSYHGMFAHVHATGRGYFAHAGNWYELVNKEVNGVVGTGTERYNIGPVDLTTLDVSGISTFAGNIDINADIDVDGHTNLDNVSVVGVATFSEDIIVNGLTVGKGASSGNNNTALGAGAFDRTGTGAQNTAIGNNALTNNQGGSGNTAVGHDASFANVNGLSNTAVGRDALRSNNNSSGNTAIGRAALYYNSAENNTALGQNSLFNVGAGKSNTAVGQSAGNNIVSGSNNLVLGYNAQATANNVSNEITLGNSLMNHLRVPGIGVSFSEGGAVISGIVTATTFKGDGDFVELDVDGHTNLDNVSITGITTFFATGTTTRFLTNIDAQGDIDLNGDLDVDGHTNLDNISIAGVTTTTDDIIIGADNKKLKLGVGEELQLYQTGNHSIIQHHGSHYLSLRSNAFNVMDAAGSKSIFSGFLNSHSSMYYNGSYKIRTQNTGAEIVGTVVATGADINGDLDVDGHTNLDNVSVAGVSTFAGSIDAYGDLDVDGHTNLDNVSVAGVTTFASTAEFDGTAKFDSTITAGGATGTNGQYLKTTGTGVEWATFPSLRTRQTFTASAGQTTFSFNYTVNFLDVFVNGVKLTDSEFTATNGTSVVLAVGSFVGDIVELVSYNTVSAGGGASGISNLVEDTSPQLGGNLDLFNKSITGTGNVNITGIISATTFKGPSGVTATFIGDGSGLTGITASGSGVIVKDSGSTVGTAGTINFGTNLSVSPASAGIVTVTAGVTTSQFNVNKLDVSGISTFKGNIDVNADVVIDGNIDLNGDIDVDGHTNLDNVSIAGITTISSDLIVTNDAPKIQLVDTNNNPDYEINANAGFFTIKDITNNASRIYIESSGTINLANNVNALAGLDATGNITATGNVIATGADINGDIDVDGHTNLDNVSIAGVVTATTFKGAVQATSGTFSSGVDITGDLDVDGHTDLDNVSVAGVVTATTFVGALTGNVTGNVSGSSGSTTGNAATATALQNARTIGGVSFDGTANINLPGVNSAGNQNTSGNAATATLATDATSFTVSANNSTNETVYPVFVDGATGSQGAETDTGLTYNPSTGNLTSTKFTGDGSGLTGITASGSGIVIKHDGSTVGTAGTINFSTNLDVSAISAGIVTVTASGGGGGVSLSGSTNNTVATVTGANALIGEANLTFDGSTLGIAAGSSDKKIQIDGTHPYIQFREGTTNKAFVQWSGSGYLKLKNEEDGATLRLRDNIQFSTDDSTFYTMWHAGNDGSGSTLDADLLDGQEGSYYSPNVGITTNLSGTFTASAGSPSTINTFGYGSGDIVVEYTVFIKNGSDFQSQKLLAMRDGTTIHSTQFAVMYSSSLLVQLDATISSGNILLRATPETGVSGSTTYKVKREVM